MSIKYYATEEYVDEAIAGGATSWNELEDKPFGEEPGLVEILPEITLDFEFISLGGIGVTEGQYEAMADIPSFVDGQEYIIVWDGVEYKTTARLDDYSEYILGNQFLSVAGGEDTGEPFGIVQDEIYGSYIYAPSESTHTISILTQGIVVKQIDEKFIPNNIARISTAAVGQAIAVKAVDEDGKPTEWEAVDVGIDGYATTQQLKQVEDKIPDQLADLQSDTSHRTVTDSEKQNWNNKSNFSGNYNDLQNKPTIPTVPTNVSAFSNDKGYITNSDIPSSLPASDVYSWAKQPNKPSYTKSEVGLGNVDNVKQYSANNPPPYPVTSVNGQTGAVDVEPKGTAASAVSTHNTNTDAHNDIRLLIEGLTTRLNTLADSDDTTLDQLSEVVEYIKDNRELIEGVTTNKISVADIIDNLTTSVTNKPLSAKQGVALKSLIDAIKIPTKLSELTADSTHRTVTDSEKSTWNAKSTFSGSYNDLTNKPTIPTVPTKVSAFTNDAGYMKSTEQQTVIDTALAQAKASGEFDGKDGRSIYTATSPAHENPDDENIYEFNTSAINTNGRDIQVDDLIIYLGTSQEFKLYKVVSIISGYVRCSYLGNLKGDKGTDGRRGFSILKVTTAPSSYTTATGGFTPTYRIALSTVKTQSKATEVLVGDTLAYNYYQYPVGYVDGSYVYLGARTSIRGATGAAYTLNDTDKATIAAAVKDSLTTEDWTFTLKDGTTVTKAVLLG